MTGAYTTNAYNNVYGTLGTQKTVGESYNKIWDGSAYVLYTVGTYATDAVDIDGFGTVRETETIGKSVRLDENGDEMMTGAYTTQAYNNVYGTLGTQKTVGESYNKIWDGSEYVLYTVGTYVTDAIDIDGFGTVRETETVGYSVRLDENGEEMTSGSYTTNAYNNVYGTLGTQVTVGESNNKIWDGSEYVLYTVGTYVTDAIDIDGFGTVRETATIGMSVRLDEKGDEMMTGSYTTNAYNNVYGTLGTQVTAGESYNRVWDGSAYVLYTVGTYTTEALSIDGFGTVRETETVGYSVRLDEHGDEMMTGSYTTNAYNNVYGTLGTQVTEGDSYNKIWDGSDYVLYTVGTYETVAVSIDGFGTVRATETIGLSVRLDEQKDEMMTGTYTTNAYNNVYGTLGTQVTVGESYNKIWDGSDYVLYTVGTYITDALSIDGFGTVRETETIGNSVRLDENGDEMMTGSYTTNAFNNVYGTLGTQVTVGESYNKIWNGSAYVLYTVGTYTTNAVVVDGFGTVRETETVGTSVKLDENGDEMMTGRYTTNAYNNVYGTLGTQVTIGESYNKIWDGTAYVLYTVGTYTTDAISIDGFGTVRETETIGQSVRLDENGDEMMTGAYTTRAYNNVYGTLGTQKTVGESYNRIWDGSAYVLYTVGTYATDAISIDGFGTVRETETIGKSVRLDENGDEMMTGAYTTKAYNNVYGTLGTQKTVGESYNRIWDGSAYVLYTVGTYATDAISIDGFGTVRETETIGQSVRLDENGDEMMTGAYTTRAYNNVYGTLGTQITAGESYNRIWDGSTYVLYTVGTYVTDAVDIDGFGTVRETETIGQSVRLDENGDEMMTGAYTTRAYNNVYGTLGTQKTVGESYNKIWNGSAYVLYTVGTYVTDVVDIDGFGTVRETETIGQSVRLDENGDELMTGAYTTRAYNNVYGTLGTQKTVGESYNKIWDGSAYVVYTVGTYITDAVDIDGFGTVRETETIGQSVRLDVNGDEMMTGAYTTRAYNNVYGTLGKQKTVGESYNKIWDGNAYVLYTVGTYMTDAVDIDGFGTVRETETSGQSVRLDENGDEMMTGAYTTLAYNNVYGTLETQETVGESYNRIWDGSAYVLYTVGTYATDSVDIDGFGTVRETETIGQSVRLDENADEMMTGAYTTKAYNNVYGTLGTQKTAGESYNRIWDGNAYVLYTVGTYITDAVDIDGFGTVRETETIGQSVRLDENADEMMTGAYTTKAYNNVYGTLGTQKTVGESYNKIWNGSAYVLYTVGTYATDAVDIDGFGTVRETETIGQSVRLDENGDEMMTGAYTTKAYNNVYGTLGTQKTVGESYNKIWDGSAYVLYTVGIYVTDAVDIDGFGTVRVTETIGQSVRLDENGDEMMTGSYTTLAYNNVYGTLGTQKTVGESYNKIWDGSAYVLYTVGTYITDAVDIDGFGTVRETETIGQSVRIDENGDEMMTGAYTTQAYNNVYGTLGTQKTVGESYNKIWNGSAYVLYTVGTYATDAVDIDGFGTVRETETIGQSVRLDESGDEMMTGAYTTQAYNNVYGTLGTQKTVGESYNKIWNGSAYVLYTVGTYITDAVDIDGFGTVRETETIGQSVRLDENGDEMMTGAYTTLAYNNVYGTLGTQKTVGESYNKIWNGNAYVLYTVGTYATDAVDIDGFGTVRETETIGKSVRLDENGDEMMTGAYTTRAYNNVYGTLGTQETVGESYNKIWNGSAYVLYTVGTYVTDAADIDGFGTVRETETIGQSVRLDENGDEMMTGAYTTQAYNNVYGTLGTQKTVGESYNKIWNGSAYVLYTVGTYATDAVDIDGFGTVRETETIGQSVRLDENGDEMMTGAYTTLAYNNVYGTLGTQKTVGESYNKIWNGSAYVLYTVGTYITDAVDIDGFGTVRETETSGQSVRLDENGDEMMTGAYTTLAYNNVYGTLGTQKTVGESYNKIWDGSAYVLYTVGTYATDAVDIDGFGTVRETETIGQSVRLDENGDEMMTGAYTTKAYNNVYGTLGTQKTVGESYNKIWDGSAYVLYTVGIYVTDAVDIDGFGTVRVTETIGQSVRLDENGDEMMTGAYTTLAYNNVYGTLGTQKTVGESYNKIWDGSAYVLYTVGTYVTDAADIDGFGTVRETETIGQSVRLDENGDEMMTGAYTTQAYNNVYGTLGTQKTVGESYNKIWNGGAYVLYTVGTYVTDAVDIDGFGTVRETETIGQSVRLDENGDEMMTGSYTTQAYNNVYGTLGTQKTVGESYNKIWNGSAYVLYTVGTYVTDAVDIDGFGTVRETETIGQSVRLDENGDEMMTGAYTTQAYNNVYGTLGTQKTVGESYNKIWNGSAYVLYTVGTYVTDAVDIDGFGTVRETETIGQSVRLDENGDELMTGAYTTQAYNNVYGTLGTQKTVGESYNKIWDGSTYVLYTVGTYVTDAVDIDGFGTVRETETIGLSVRLDENGDEMMTGSYTTRAYNNVYGTLGTQKTVGESYNKIWDGNAYVLYTVGTYVTDAVDIDGYGTVRETETIGQSVRLDENGDEMMTGAYTTLAYNNVYGTLGTQKTVGESYNKIWNGNAYVLYTVGTYATDAVDIDGFGTVRETETIGQSVRLDENGDEMMTGAYTTNAYNNVYGTLGTQKTVGESYNKIWDGSAYVLYTVGTYVTDAVDIDGFGTVRVTETIGKSVRIDENGDEMMTGAYTTQAYNNVYGTLGTQKTVGESYNRIWDGNAYVLYTVGTYVTDAVDIDGYGTVRETETIGQSVRIDENGDEMMTGAYTTLAYNNVYGTLGTQKTVGESYNKIWDSSAYVLYTVGTYVTDAADIDGFGTVRETETIGQSVRLDENGMK